MKKLLDLKDILIEKLNELFSAEKQQMKALPELIRKSKDPDLKALLDDHLLKTDDQVIRMERIFTSLYQEPSGKTNTLIKTMLKESERLMKKSAASEVLDAVLVTSVQQIEHYEIANYGACATYATLLGDIETASLLHKSLMEEKEMDKRLAMLAEEQINVKARKVGEERKASI